MIRSAFLRRMALAAAACAFIDVPWPKAASWKLPDVMPTLPNVGDVVELRAAITGWADGRPVIEVNEHTWATYRYGRLAMGAIGIKGEAVAFDADVGRALTAESRVVAPRAIATAGVHTMAEMRALASRS